MNAHNLPCGTSPHWVCYVAMGKQLAAGPYHDADAARANAADIAGYVGVTTCYVFGGPRPPRGFLTLEDVAAGRCDTCGGPTPPDGACRECS
jgi:hypothetical protein